METMKKKEKMKMKTLTFQHEANQEVIYNDPQCSRSFKRKRSTEAPGSIVIYKSIAMERAEEIQANLDPKYPILIKLMVRSHVSGCFWLGLNKWFCDTHMPDEDIDIFLEDEIGNMSKVKYLKRKNGLSGGWKGFSVKHNIMEGDAVVFHLVEPTKCKVYIVRANSLDEDDGPLSSVQASVPQIENEVHGESKTKQNVQIVSSKTKSDDHGSGEPLEAIRFSENTSVDFKEVQNLENFTISLHGLVIDSEISNHFRRKYYELCNSQGTYLHQHLIEGLNCKLAAGIIAETVNIFDAIQATKVSTSTDHFIIWDKTLKAFEDMGMIVGFLREKLAKLLGIRTESRKYAEDSLRKSAEANEQMRSLQNKLLEVKAAAKKVDVEIKNLTVTAVMHDTMFREEVGACW